MAVTNWFLRMPISHRILFYAHACLSRRLDDSDLSDETRIVRQDADGKLAHTNKSKVYSAIFLVVFGITFTFASIDWIMSLEPMFFSTIYAFYHIAGVLLSGTASITVLVILLSRRGFLKEAGDKQLHFLGKMVLGFATFWAYIWLCQYLLIYYANIPEETVYYFRRTSTTGWANLFILNLFLNWIIPFACSCREK